MAAASIIGQPGLQSLIGRGTTAPAAAATALVLTAANNGQSFRIDPQGAVACTLPAPAAAAGCSWTVVKGTAAGNNIAITSPQANTVVGQIAQNAGGTVTVAVGTTLTILAAAGAGTKADIYCDGVLYHVTARAVANNAITLA